MNKVLLVGRLTRDPELRTSQSGTAIVRFTVAVDQRFTNKNGERGTDFISCVAFERTASNVGRYCHKGTMVSVEGRISTGSYDAPDGTKRYTTDVVCENVNFLSPKSSNDGANTYNNSVVESPVENTISEEEINGMATADLSEDPFKSFSEEVTLSSDDLPF